MTIDELRAKFEAWYPNAIGDVQPFECYEKGYASRDAEVEAMRKDADRYRWLRKNHNADLLAEDIIDEAIDAAMRDND